MHLGEIIKKYRAEHNLSQAEFAKISKISKGYISMLENNKNPSTGEPLAPTYTIFEKVSKATGYEIDALLRAMDDRQMIAVNLAARALDYTESELMQGLEEKRIHITNLIGTRFDEDTGEDDSAKEAPTLKNGPNKDMLLAWIENASREELIEALQAVTKRLGEL